MKNYVLLFVAVLALSLHSCKTMKNTEKTTSLYNTAWELEYISGPRIAFEGLFPNKKPVITLDEATKMVSGNAGCNGFSALYTLDGKAISFGEQGATTMMFCEGGGEQQFLKTIQQVNAYSIDKDGKLNLMLNDIPMMRFKKVTK